MKQTRKRKDRTLSRPGSLYSEMLKDYPDALNLADRTRREYRFKDKDFEWPNWCFIPMLAWRSMAAVGFIKNPPVSDLAHNNIEISRLFQILPWGYSKGIYRFDPEVFDLLVNAPPEGNLPSEVLTRLPEWSLYIETQRGIPGFEEMRGFFASLDYDFLIFGRPYRKALCLLLDTESGLIPFTVPLGDYTVTESLSLYLQLMGESAEQSRVPSIVMGALVKPLLSLLLWICSDAPEIDSEREPGTSPSFPRPKKVMGAWRIFPVGREKVLTVGRTTGEQLRKAASSHAVGAPTGRHVRPHLRRGHWHGYWQGPRNSVTERRFVYRFLSPILVNPQRGEEEATAGEAAKPQNSDFTSAGRKSA